MPLQLDAGHATRRGLRERNEDFVGMVTPLEPALSSKGFIGAVADGVSGNEGGREASEYAVRGLLADYYATPDTWPVTQAVERVLKASNNWILHHGSVRTELAGMATTLTSLVLRGSFYYFSHVGDTRLYLLRAGVMTQLTSDHVWDRPEMQHVLTRAIGLDTQLTVDHGIGQLQERDVFLIASDGLWSAIPQYDLAFHLSQLAQGTFGADACAGALLDAALAGGSSDNLSALVVAVRTLPEQNLRDSLSMSHELRPPPKLQVGQTLDGYRVEALIHASATTLLYQVIDTQDVSGAQRKLVLKTLQPERGDDARERDAFVHEEWLARRVIARFFPQVITTRPPNYLYYLTTWHAGHSLQQHLDIGHHFTVPEVLALAEQLVRAVGALHRRSIIHRDIKPANVHLGEDGQLRLLDLGLAQSGMTDSDDDRDAAPQAGTPSYLAPEQFDNAPAALCTDLYATGVTLYQMLTRHYPYGEIEPFQRPRFGQPVAPTRYRPEIPQWLENVLLKSVARDPIDRFETAEELLLALQRAASRPLPTPSAAPLAKRDPLALWYAISALSIVGNLLLLYLLVLQTVH
ncbi:MAG: serine/threonine protein kinase/serine/threonine protein phosphatase PrpC [Janthinobacterium sp.]|jgi:serine/threonine protein kinase/serine/threonine protein phosphatase PrpC